MLLHSLKIASNRKFLFSLSKTNQTNELEVAIDWRSEIYSGVKALNLPMTHARHNCIRINNINTFALYDTVCISFNILEERLIVRCSELETPTQKKQQKLPVARFTHHRLSGGGAVTGLVFTLTQWQRCNNTREMTCASSRLVG